MVLLCVCLYTLYIVKYNNFILCRLETYYVKDYFQWKENALYIIRDNVIYLYEK